MSTPRDDTESLREQLCTVLAAMEEARPGVPDVLMAVFTPPLLRLRAERDAARNRVTALEANGTELLARAERAEAERDAMTAAAQHLLDTSTHPVTAYAARAILAAADTPEALREDPAEREHGDDPYLHVVGNFQHWMDRLGLKIPRALCGISLEGDPDKPEPGPDAPTCPRCVAVRGES